MSGCFASKFRWQCVTEKANVHVVEGVGPLFDYARYRAKGSPLIFFYDKVGSLTLKLELVEALDKQEHYLLVAASTTLGIGLAEDDLEKFSRLHAVLQTVSQLKYERDAALIVDITRRNTKLLQNDNLRNLGNSNGKRRS